MKALAKFEPQAYALLRIVSGLAFSVHGLKKVFGLFGGHVPEFPIQMWLGGVIFLFAGLAIGLGVRTREAAFLSSGTMAVAYTQFHWKLQLGEQLLPAVNKGELALIYCFVFLLFACKGSGIWALKRD